MIHLNGNIICAVDTETTGLVAGEHDIIQICVLPLDNNLCPRKDIFPFYTLIKPKRPENAVKEAMRVNGIKLSDAMLQGLDPWKAVDLFLEWFERLKLPEKKRIMPLGQNYQFDMQFLKEWLCPQTYELCFHHHYRDTMNVAEYLNDRAAVHGEPYPFQKTNLTYLAQTLGVEHERGHDALQDCLVTAQVYRKMLTLYTANFGVVATTKEPDKAPVSTVPVDIRTVPVDRVPIDIKINESITLKD